MISYRIEGNYPVHNSTVTLGFSNEEPIIKVADIIANLGYKYSDDKTIYPIQSGEELVWVCERDETCTSRVIVELSAPYQAKYQKIDIAMPRGFEDKFEWKNPDEDPIIARTYVGDTNFKIQFSQVVEAHEIIDWVKIAGRDCILSPSGTQFIWKDTDPEHETPLEDITAGYVPECDELTIFVPADSRVDTVQWVAAEPIPIEQMYHKKEHMPFFPKTAFGAVFDHNGNSLSRVMSDMIDRMRLAEEDIDDLEAAIGGKVDFDDFIKRVKVNTLPVSLESEDETKYIYHLIEKSGTHEPGYYIFAGNNEVGNPIFNRIDNTLDDVENAQAYKFYARKLNTLTGKLEWKPVTGGGAGGVQDVTVNGESVVDDDGVAVIDTTEFGKVQDVLVDGASVLDADGNAIIDLASKADKATTLAGYEIGDAYTKDEVDAKIDEKIETLDAAEVGTAGQYIQKIKEENGIITATVADVKQTYSATDTEPISGAGVKAAIDELDVDVVGEDGKYLKTIKQDDGKITAVAEAFDTTITADATNETAPTSKAVHTVTGLVTDITEDAAKSDGTATGTAPKNLAEAINNVAKNAGSINKITDENGNEFTPDDDKIVAITTATTDDLGLVKTDEDKITATSTAKTNDALAMTGKAIEDSLAWKIVGDKDGAVQTYKGATASANYAVAAGNGAIASGEGAVAIGNTAIASGQYSVAIGMAAKATGLRATAIGNNTAEGPFSFAEGTNCKTTENGLAAHAEGSYTTADAGFAHVEGEHTEVHAIGGHAEGNYTKVAETSYYAHVEGSGTKADKAPYAHAEGLNTIVTNAAEHAEGSYNVSHKSDAKDKATIHSIGIGTGSGSDKNKNAFEVMQNGDAYLMGVGNYEGTDITTATNNVKTLATVINSKAGIQVLTKEEYDDIAEADIEPLTIYFIKKQDSAGKDYISTFYVGAIPFGASTGFMLGTNKLDSDKL